VKDAYIKNVQKRNQNVLKITEKDQLERLSVYDDRYPMLVVRKSATRIVILVKMMAFHIISSKTFDNISIMVILANSLTMVLDDSSTNDNPNPIFATLETVFLVLYTAEMVFKIIGMGFFFSKNAYIKDSWNILDFFIVLTSYMTVFQSLSGSAEGSDNIAG
jgi:hypothetical protein